jgi:hypothetical protein
MKLKRAVLGIPAILVLTGTAQQTLTGQLVVVANGIASNPVQGSVITPQGCLNTLDI